METYWLVGKADGSASAPQPLPSTPGGTNTPGFNASHASFPIPSVPSTFVQPQSVIEAPPLHTEPPTVSFNMNATIVPVNYQKEKTAPNLPPPLPQSEASSTAPL